MSSHCTFEVTDMKSMEAWLHSKEDEVKAWPGVESIVFAKTSESTIMSVVVYESRDAMDANGPRFKAAMGETQAFVSSVKRDVGEVIVV